MGKKVQLETHIGGDKKKKKSKQDTCFTIMPFDDWPNVQYQTVFSPAIVAAGLLPKRADDLYRPSSIIKDIWNYTKQATIVLADLTNRNPNVLYELGLAHAIAKPVVMVVEDLEDIPFDLRGLRVIEYNKNDPAWGDELKRKITTAISEVLENPSDSISPTFLVTKTENAVDTGDLTRQEKDLVDLRQQIVSLRREVRSSESKHGSHVLNVEPAHIKLPSVKAGLIRDFAARIRVFVDGGYSEETAIFEVINELRDTIPAEILALLAEDYRRGSSSSQSSSDRDPPDSSE